MCLYQESDRQLKKINKDIKSSIIKNADFGEASLTIKSYDDEFIPDLTYGEVEQIFSEHMSHEKTIPEHQQIIGDESEQVTYSAGN